MHFLTSSAILSTLALQLISAFPQKNIYKLYLWIYHIP